MPERPVYEEIESIVRKHDRLKKSLQRIFDTSPDLIGFADLQGYFKQINGSFEKILGYSPEEFCSKPFLHFVHEDDREKTAEALASASTGAKLIEIENRYRCKNGECKWIDWKVWDTEAGGQYIAVGRDITDRKQLEELLRNRTEILNTILDNIPAMIVVIDQHRAPQFINRCFQNTLCCQPDMARGVDIWAELYPDPEEFQRAIDFIDSSSGDWEEFTTRALDGRMLDLLCASISLRDGTKIGIGIDLTEKKRLKKALTASEQRYAAIAAAAQDCIFIKNENRQYAFLNPAAIKLFGRKQEALLGKTPEQLYGPRYAAVINAVDDRTFQGETVNEIRPLSIDGREHILHTIQFPLERKDGKVISISGIVRDITDNVRQRERKEEIEAQQLQIQKLESLGTLAGGIAHDFNNMLGVILGNASYGQSLLTKEDPLVDILSSIQTGASQARLLTQQLLTFARGGAPIKQSTDLNRLIEESARFVTRGSKCGCAFELSTDLWPGDVDPGQVNQAIGNLVINACQAMPEGGTVTITTANAIIKDDTALPLSPGRYVKIVVEDQGMGIAPEDLPRIFDPYFSTKEKGTGLGLATTFSIIKRHGGHITVRSALQNGTAFTLFLAACSEKHAQTEEKQTKHQGRGKVLVMDDHNQILIMAGIMLGEMGYEAFSATDGLQAVEMVRQGLQSGAPYDLIILDLTVPGGMGGAEAMREILKIDPGIKAIVSSGYSNDPVMADYKAHGFQGILPKPYTRDQLAGVLNSVFGRDGQP
ncbi:MAG: PAS domain S-box protein [Thermodesulfobacteriota bacterium]